MTIHRFGQFQFDDSDGELRLPDAGRHVALRPQVARLLACFLRHPHTVLNREQLCRAVWGDDHVIDFEAGLSALIKELRQAFSQLDPSATLIETVPRRGYRFLGDPATDTAPAGRRRILAGTVGALLILGLAAISWYWLAPPAAEPRLPAVAILPFDASLPPAQSLDNAELLLADALLARLWQLELPDLLLVGRASMRPYTGREDVAAAVARDLGVNLLIEGSIYATPAGWTVDARLLELPRGQVIWSTSVTWPAQGALPAAETAEQIAAQLDAVWPELAGERGWTPVSE